MSAAGQTGFSILPPKGIDKKAGLGGFGGERD